MTDPSLAPTDFPSFAVGCGEEASDPLVWHDGGLVRVDELAASGHVERRDSDLADVAALGISTWRYGVPWRITEPEPGIAAMGSALWGIWNDRRASRRDYGMALGHVVRANLEARLWHDRCGADFWVAETSNLGFPHERQEEWLAALVGVLDGLLAEGRPVRGVCWYSRGDQYDWDTALAVPVGRVTEVGLFDTERRPRPVAAAYARLTAARR